MNEDTLNMEVRKYLKKVGITSQRQIEHAVLKAIDHGVIQGTETLEVQISLTVPVLKISYQIDGQIALE
jgi:ribosomal protein L1